MSWVVNLFCSRRSIDQLIASRPTQKQVDIRLAALRRLVEDCERFFPMPALVESLSEDIERLRERRLVAGPDQQTKGAVA